VVGFAALHPPYFCYNTGKIASALRASQ